MYNNTTSIAEEHTMKLCNDNLEHIQDVTQNLTIPRYDRSAVQEGVLQIGVGNFHRAHAGTYFDDLLATGEANEWGIVGAGMHSKKRRDVIEPQDWLQTIIELDGDHYQARIIGSMVNFVPVEPEKHHAMYEKMIEPNIKIVGLLATEGGYYLKNGTFDKDAKDVQKDVANPDKPITAFGVIIKALKARKDKGLKPFTVMSCDNIPHNGDVAKSVVVGLAKQTDSEFADWIEKNVAFPNSMVDRITPTSADENFLKKNLKGLEDEMPVVCEPYRQWVMEDNFCNGRPPLDKVGVRFVKDVTPFETMKLRILNGGHASLSYAAALLGIEYVHEAVQHEAIGPFLDCLQRNEIIPTIPTVPDTNLDEYWETVQKRFSNKAMKDTIERQTDDGSQRQPKFIVPTLKDALKNDSPVDGLALVSAIWCRYCRGEREDGSKVNLNDSMEDELKERASKAKDNPKAWLDLEIYQDVREDDKFVDAFCKALKSIDNDGVEGAMKKYCESMSKQG